MPRFSLKDMFLAMTLVACGIAVIWIPIATQDYSDPNGVPKSQVFLIWVTGFALFFAGLFAPFKRKWIGAMVGIGIYSLLALLFNDFMVR